MKAMSPLSIPVDVRRDEWLEAIQDAMPSGATDGKTVRELVNETGVHYKQIQALIARLQCEGRIVCKRTVRIGIDGRRAMVPAYILTPKEEGQCPNHPKGNGSN